MIVSEWCLNCSKKTTLLCQYCINDYYRLLSKRKCLHVYQPPLFNSLSLLLILFHSLLLAISTIVWLSMAWVADCQLPRIVCYIAVQKHGNCQGNVTNHQYHRQKMPLPRPLRYDQAPFNNKPLRKTHSSQLIPNFSLSIH